MYVSKNYVTSHECMVVRIMIRKSMCVRVCVCVSITWNNLKGFYETLYVHCRSYYSKLLSYKCKKLLNSLLVSKSTSTYVPPIFIKIFPTVCIGSNVPSTLSQSTLQQLQGYAFIMASCFLLINNPRIIVYCWKPVNIKKCQGCVLKRDTV
jgi:hypothetical protein